MSLPSLSVVISTSDPPSEVVPKFANLRREVRQVGGEFLIVSGKHDANPVPDDVRIHIVPGGSVFDCRHAAVTEARADIVALTEDHCLHPEGWCGRIIDQFASQPDLVILGGCVANGSAASVEDRMNYWMTFSTYAPGFMTARAPCIAQYIVRRSRLGFLEVSDLEFVVPGKFEKVQGAVLMDSDLAVTHVQSHGFARTFVIHYHNGRATAGFLWQGHEAAKTPAALRRAYRNGWRHIKAVWRSQRKGEPSVVRRIGRTLLILPLVLCHCAGMAVGFRHGPGKSPYYLA